VSLNVLVFIYQIATTVNSLRVRFPSHWPRHALSMVADAAWGSSVAGPLTLDFASSPRLGRLQPHRFVTAGFLHGGILHLLLNVDALRRTPDWLETGLGVPLYLTTYLLSIVAGNFGHSLGSAASVGAGQSLCLGSSGGICGLYGLMWISLARMGNQSAASRVARGVALIFLYGALIPDVSNASHVGGFVAGALIGFLFGPSYAKSYAMRRKWSVEVDNSPKDYRLAMGFGKRPSKSGMLSLSALWVVVGATLLSQAKFRSMPRLVLQGLLKPGSVYAQLFR
jgi:membrane associated rhomboid family serine protease